MPLWFGGFRIAAPKVDQAIIVTSNKLACFFVKMQWLDVAIVFCWYHTYESTTLETKNTNLHVQTRKDHLQIALSEFEARDSAFCTNAKFELSQTFTTLNLPNLQASKRITRCQQQLIPSYRFWEVKTQNCSLMNHKQLTFLKRQICQSTRLVRPYFNQTIRSTNRYELWARCHALNLKVFKLVLRLYLSYVLNSVWGILYWLTTRWQ